MSIEYIPFAQGKTNRASDSINLGYKIIISNQDAWDFGCVGNRNTAFDGCFETGQS